MVENVYEETVAQAFFNTVCSIECIDEQASTEQQYFEYECPYPDCTWIHEWHPDEDGPETTQVIEEHRKEHQQNRGQQSNV